jgi:hypothetical protein
VYISAPVAHRLNNDIQEAMGALDLALVAEDTATKNRRIKQSKQAIRKAAEFVAAHTVRSEN